MNLGINMNRIENYLVNVKQRGECDVGMNIHFQDYFEYDREHNFIQGVMFRYPAIFIKLCELFRKGYFRNQSIDLPDKEGVLFFFKKNNKIFIKAFPLNQHFPFSSKVKELLDAYYIELSQYRPFRMG